MPSEINDCTIFIKVEKFNVLSILVEVDKLALVVCGLFDCLLNVIFNLLNTCDAIFNDTCFTTCASLAFDMVWRSDIVLQKLHLGF